MAEPDQNVRNRFILAEHDSTYSLIPTPAVKPLNLHWKIGEVFFYPFQSDERA